MNIHILILIIIISIFVFLIIYPAIIISSRRLTPEERKYEDDMQIKWLKENERKYYQPSLRAVSAMVRAVGS